MYNKTAVVTSDDRRFVVKLCLERNRVILEHRVGPQA